MSWVSTEARGAVTNITGEYLLDEVDGQTTVTYRSPWTSVCSSRLRATQGAKRVIDNALEA